MSNAVESLSKSINKILSVRETVGATLKKVSIITRTWSGTGIGFGTLSDVAKEIKPDPYVVDFSHDIRLREGGAIKQGDRLVKSISKENFPLESELDGSSSADNIEKFYDIGGILYQVITVREKYLTWNVHVRRLSDQTR